MSGIYIPGAKIPNGDYVRVLMLHKDGTCVDGIGNVFKVIPIPPHGRLIDADAVSLEGGPYEYDEWCKWALEQYQDAPTIIPAEEG